MSRVDYVSTAKSAGYAMPAEWGPHERCWMQWPYRGDHMWPDVSKTQEDYAAVAKAIRQFEPVTMIAGPDELSRAEELCGPTIDYLVMDLEDSWARDSGPNFVKNGDKLAASNFHFNAWGQKYERFRRDAAVGHSIAEFLGIPAFGNPLFLEGGGVCVDGEGTILTTEQCVLHPNRNPGLSKQEAERVLCDALGGETVIWLPGDPDDDETDGHIDGLACFVRPGVVLCEVASEDMPERRKNLRENWRALKRATDARGRSLEIIPIVEASDADPVGERYCSSYINFYIANGGIVMPSYGTASDDVAKETVSRAFPDRQLVSLRIDNIVLGGGGIHCITQQQPA